MWTGQKLACLSVCLSDAPGVGWGGVVCLGGIDWRTKKRKVLDMPFLVWMHKKEQ